ncbi:MAG: hypothetical protein JXA20_11625 [Spirochaetes bacterium]|nr:hypothetical protein [Spirochaetota bacterium]
MHIDSTNLILLLLSVFAGAICFYTAIAGFSFEGFYGKAFVPFAMMGIIGAWYCIWSGIRNADIFRSYPFIVTMSTVMSGFAGPVLYLLSRSMSDIYKKLDVRLYWLLLFGLFGASFSVYAIFDEETAGRFYRAYHQGELGNLGIWSYMFYLHVAELCVFAMMSLVTIIRALRSRTKPSKEKLPAMLVLSGIGIAVLTITFSAILP